MHRIATNKQAMAAFACKLRCEERPKAGYSTKGKVLKNIGGIRPTTKVREGMSVGDNDIVGAHHSLCSQSKLRCIFYSC